MFRRLMTLAALFALTVSSLATTAAQAGCHSGGYRGHTVVRHARTYVRPVTVVRERIVRPQVQVALPAVDPEPEHPVVPAGSTLTIPANFLGQAPGSVFMVFNNIKLPVQVQNWSMTGVTITLPPMAIKETVLIRLDLVLPHGELGHTQKLYVTPPAPVVLHPTAPQSPLPTNAALQGLNSSSVGLFSQE